MLQNLVPDTPYNITVEAVYPEGPGGSLTGPGRTGEKSEIPEINESIDFYLIRSLDEKQGLLFNNLQRSLHLSELPEVT